MGRPRVNARRAVIERSLTFFRSLGAEGLGAKRLEAEGLIGRNGAVRRSPCSFRMLDRRSDSAGSRLCS
jgi:hypothetical protein